MHRCGTIFVYLQRPDGSARLVGDGVPERHGRPRTIVCLAITHLQRRFALGLVPILLVLMCLDTLDRLLLLTAKCRAHGDELFVRSDGNEPLCYLYLPIFLLRRVLDVSLSAH